MFLKGEDWEYETIGKPCPKTQNLSLMQDTFSFHPLVMEPLSLKNLGILRSDFWGCPNDAQMPCWLRLRSLFLGYGLTACGPGGRAVQAVALSQNFAPAASKNATQEYLRQGCDTVILQHACVRHLAVVTKTKWSPNRASCAWLKLQ